MADETEPTALATLDMGDLGSESARNQSIAAQLFPDDEDSDDTPPETAPETPPEPRSETPPEPAPEPAQAGSDVPGFTKDAKGRYHRPDGTVASKEEVEKARASVRASTGTPEPVPQADGTPEPAKVEEEPEDAPEPVQWLAYGKPVSIEGAQYKRGHGYFIPEAKGPELRQAWARGHVRYPQVVEENAKLREALGSTFTQKEAEAHAAIEVLGRHLGSAEAFRQFLEEAGQYPELALRELRVDIQQKQNELGARVSTPDAALMANEPDVGEVAEALTDELEQMFRATELTGKFTPAAQRALTDRVFQRAAAYLTRADRDYPEDGVTKGALVVNRAALWADLQYEASRSGAPPKAPTPVRPAAPSGEKASPNAPPAPPSAVGRSRTIPTPPAEGTRNRKATIPTRSLKEAADWLLSDDD